MEQISKNISRKISCCRGFNLGYLPGGNKQVTTTAEDTETAVRRAADLIRKDGVVTVVMYDGHGEGAREKRTAFGYGRSAAQRQISCSLCIDAQSADRAAAGSALDYEKEVRNDEQRSGVDCTGH